jgi:putative polyhydroxyalkanoate system protein
MPKLAVVQPHSVAPEEARKRIEDLGRDLGEKYGISSEWTSGTQATLKGRGASGLVTIEPAAVRVALDLSFALTPMKGAIEARVKQELQRLFP